MSGDNSTDSEELDEIIETERDYYWDDETQNTVTSNRSRYEHQNLHHQPDTTMEVNQDLSNNQDFDPLALSNADWTWGLENQKWQEKIF